MHIFVIDASHPLWEPVARYAEACSWRAGPHLARMMRQRRLRDWERVLAAVDGEQIAGYCTVSEKDTFPDSAYTPFIGYMFVGERYRGGRLSEKLIEHACRYLQTLGYDEVYIISGETGLYEKYGFLKIGDHQPPFGETEQIFMKRIE